MRKGIKTIISVAAAAVMACGALSLTACGAKFTPLKGDYTSETPAVSNGGFVVEYGKYVYFINGVETYTSDNTYGTPVKGALMRISKSDLLAGNNTAETVIPSLMVAADYTSGIYVYGDRVYYATPNNRTNTSGQVENTYLDFKSAKLDGSDVRSYFHIDTNSTVYRYVQPEENGAVYLVYVTGSSSAYTVNSYNTQTKTETALVENATAYVLSSDVTDPYVYYTMTVQDNIDTEDSATTRSDYNQIYRVRADVTEAPYEYVWDQDYLDDHDGKAPYVNLGTIVLDGIGSAYRNDESQFTHDLTDGVTPISAAGFTYTLQSYTNGGIYFTRTEAPKAGDTTGSTGELYYLSADKLGSGWNSVSGNLVKKAGAAGSLDVVAQSTNTGKASSSALFYLDDAGHHYLYVDGSSIYRADVKADGTGDNEREVEICRDASGATLLSIDNSDSTYHYVWFTRSNGSGTSVERAVYNGEEKNYDVLPFYGEESNAPYKPVKVLDLQHASSWYKYEVLDGIVFFADAETIGSVSYNYVSVVNLANLNNEEIETLNDKYDELFDATDGYFAKVSKDDTKLSTAYKYFFNTGKTEAFYANIEEAVELGKKETYLYTEEQQNAFKAFAEGTGETEGKFVDEDGNSYRVRSYFITRLGEMSEADATAIDDYWTGTLERYVVTQTDTSLPTWAIAVIVVGAVLVAAGAGLGVFFGVRAKKKAAQGAEGKERLHVDTTDDRSVDVYAEPEPAETQSPAEETAEPAEEAEKPEE